MANITGGVTQQVLQKAFENSQTQNQPVSQPGKDSTFQNMLQNSQEAFDLVDKLGYNETTMKPQSVSAESIHFDMSQESKNANGLSTGDKLTAMVEDFNYQQHNSDNLVNEIMFSDKKFNNQELLAVQAHVYRMAQETEIVVKAVDFTLSSFKGVMNTQMGS